MTTAVLLSTNQLYKLMNIKKSFASWLTEMKGIYDSEPQTQMFETWLNTTVKKLHPMKYKRAIINCAKNKTYYSAAEMIGGTQSSLPPDQRTQTAPLTDQKQKSDFWNKAGNILDKAGNIANKVGSEISDMSDVIEKDKAQTIQINNATLPVNKPKPNNMIFGLPKPLVYSAVVLIIAGIAVTVYIKVKNK